MTVNRIFGICLAFILFVLIPVSNSNGQLSSIAWKAAEQLTRNRSNSVKYNKDGFVTAVVIHDLPHRFIMGHLEVFPHLESVTIDSRYYFEDANMGGVRKLKKMKKFSLRNSRYATGATLELLAEAPALESLDLYENGEIRSLQEVSRIRRLKHLSVVPDDALSYTPLVECDRLESVKLTGSAIDDSSITELAKIETLQSIDLSGSSITDEGLAELGKLPKLQKLILKKCKTITGEGFAEFQFPESLKELNLEETKILNDDGLGELSRFSQIEDLRLYRNSEIKGSGFECLASMQKLITLQCPETSIADKHLALLDGISTLKTIWFPGCRGVSGRGIDRLSQSQGCTRMSLNRCTKIDSPDFAVLAKFKDLEQLYIANTRIRNDDIDLLCKLKKLKTLNIGGNVWLDDSAFEKLEDSSIEKLIATDLPRLSDAAFQSASKMKNLVNLCVTAHDKLNGSGMKSFVGNTQMKYLTFEAPNHLSLEALSSIRKLSGVEEIYFNEGKITLSQLEQLSGMQSLRKLRYKVEDSKSSNERLISILKTFPKLE